MNTVYPKRHVIKGVQKMNSGKADEDFYFIACMKELLAFLKEDPMYDYNYLCSISGAAFTFLWDQGNWTPKEDITHFGCNWEYPVRRVFESVGYGYISLKNDGSESCKKENIRNIQESLYINNRPVLAWGVLNTEPICCMITGYDDWGETLIGWHYRQFSQGLCNEYDYGGYFRKTNWFANTSQILLITERKDKPNFMTVTEQTMREAHHLITKQTNIMGYCAGTAAYEGWIRDMKNNDFFERQSLESLKIKAGCIVRTCELAAEVYWNAMDFFKAVSTWHDLMAEYALLAAADFVAQTDIMYKIWYILGALKGETVHAEQLAKKEVRDEIINLLEKALFRSKQAAKHIQRGLKTIKVMKQQYYLNPGNTPNAK